MCNLFSSSPIKAGTNACHRYVCYSGKAEGGYREGFLVECGEGYQGQSQVQLYCYVHAVQLGTVGMEYGLKVLQCNIMEVWDL